MNRIALRPIEQEDGPALTRIFADDDVSAWLAPPGASGSLGSEQHAKIAARKAAHWQAHGFGQWLALIEGAAVGRGGLQHTVVDGRGEVEIGWAVARAHWGRGIGSHIAVQGMQLADQLGIIEVVAFTRPDNARSLALMKRCGMTFERRVTIQGLEQILYRRNRPGDQPRPR